MKRGLLYPLAGPPIQVTLDPVECDNEATTAIELLDSYNAAVAAGKSLMAMATPSPDACHWCPYKTVCPGFWTTVSLDWSGKLDGEAIRGEVVASPQPVLAADAFSLIVRIEGGTQASGSSIRLSPLPALVHRDLASLVQGQRVVMIRLGRKADGAPYPLLQTVLSTADML